MEPVAAPKPRRFRHRWERHHRNPRYSVCRNCGCERRLLPNGTTQYVYTRAPGNGPACDRSL